MFSVTSVSLYLYTNEVGVGDIKSGSISGRGLHVGTEETHKSKKHPPIVKVEEGGESVRDKTHNSYVTVPSNSETEVLQMYKYVPLPVSRLFLYLDY